MLEFLLFAFLVLIPFVVLFAFPERSTAKKYDGLPFVATDDDDVALIRRVHAARRVC